MTYKSETLPRGVSQYGILILTSLFCALRLALNWKSPDIISTPDELYQGYIGVEWLRGLRANLFHYQGDSYTAGSLVTGTLAVPFFAVLGKNLFALKCVPLLFSAGAFWGFLRLIRRQFNEAAAFAVGILLLLSPPGYTVLSLMALGSHPEAAFWMVMLLTALERYGDAPSQFRAFLFGVSGGLACWLAPINIPADLFCSFLFLYYLIRRKLPFAHLNSKVLGAVLGFSPWFFYNASHRWQGVAFFRDSVRGISSEGFLSLLIQIPGALFSLLRIHFPMSLFFEFGLLNTVYAVLLLICFLFFAVAGIQKKDEQKQARLFFYFYAGFPILFLIIFACFQKTFSWHHEVTPFRFRYFAPLFYFLVLPPGVLLSRSRKFLPVYLFLILCGIMGQMQLFASPSLLPGIQRPGYFLENPRRVFDLARGYEEPQFQFPDWRTFASFSDAKASIKKEPASFQPVYEMSLGASLFTWNSVTAQSEAAFDDLNLNNPEISFWIIRGIGHSLLWTLESPAMLDKAVKTLQAEPWVLSGIYWGLGWKLREYQGDARLIAQYPEAIAKSMKAGFESYLPRK